MVSCMGHFTSRFGSVRPQGRVMGYAMSCVAVIWAVEPILYEADEMVWQPAQGRE